jgi:hypothetical protein
LLKFKEPPMKSHSMMFPRGAASALLLMLALAGCAHGPSASLVTLQAVNEPNENNKRLNASFREVQRLEHHSLIEVVVDSGGSVSSSLFYGKGFCAVMRARGWARASPTTLGAGRWQLRNADAPPDASLDPVEEAIEAMSPNRAPMKPLTTAQCSLMRW